MKKIRMPDGRVVRFGDDYTDEAIREFIFSNYPEMRKGINVSDEQKEQIRKNVAAFNAEYQDIEKPQDDNRVLDLAGKNLFGNVGYSLIKGALTNKALQKGLEAMDGRDMLDVAGQSLQGAERVADGASFGLYGLGNRLVGGNYAERKAELQQQAEKAGVGGLNEVVGGGLELAGGIPSGALSYNLAGKAGLKGVSRLAGASGLEGLLWGASGADNVTDGVINAATGAALGSTGGAALGVVGQGLKKLVPGLMTVGRKSGLKEAMTDDEAVKILKSATKNSEEVAQEINREAPEVLADTNTKMAEELNQLTGRKLDISQALKNQKQRYDDFISRNADYELLDFSPTREELSKYAAQSKFNLPKTKLSPEEAGEILKDRAAKSDIEVDGTIGHYTNKRDRGQYTRTLSNTLKNPDVVFNIGNKGYVVKKYDTNDKPFFDFVTKKDGKLYDKFNTDANYVDNQLKKTAQNVSLSGRIIESNAGPTHSLPSMINNSIPLQRVVVNKNLPRLDDFSQGLTEYQQAALEKALTKGGEMSLNAKGTLGATHRAQEVLNDMIEASFDKSVLGQKIPTTETRQLMELKNRFNQILEPSGVKTYDRGLSKAKNLQNFFEKGYNFKPSELKFDKMGLKTSRDKRAFLQGRIARILDNVKETKSVAKAIEDDYNTLKKLMPERQFKSLKEAVTENKTVFDRMSDLQNRAKNKVVTPEARDRPYSEKWEGLGSIIGSAADKVDNLVYGRAYRKAAQHLLSGKLTPEESLLLDALSWTTPAAIGQYLDEEVF